MHPPMSSSLNDVAYWRQQVDQRQTSGLSQTQYCKTHQLTYHRFIYWRQKIESVEGSQAVKTRSSGFASVTVHPQRETDLSLSLPNGMVVRGIHADNVRVLSQLLAQL